MTEEQNKLAELVALSEKATQGEWEPRVIEDTDDILLACALVDWFRANWHHIFWPNIVKREPATEAVLARALKNEAAFHCLLHHCQRALSMPSPHTFDKELSDGVHAAIAISHGEKTPMKLHFDNDWVKRTTAADPDVDIEAGPDIALKGKGASQGVAAETYRIKSVAMGPHVTGAAPTYTGEGVSMLQVPSAAPEPSGEGIFCCLCGKNIYSGEQTKLIDFDEWEAGVRKHSFQKRIAHASCPASTDEQKG